MIKEKLTQINRNLRKKKKVVSPSLSYLHGYSKLDMKNVIDNRKFGNAVESFLSDKTKIQGKITLTEKDEIVSDDKKFF